MTVYGCMGIKFFIKKSFCGNLFSRQIVIVSVTQFYKSKFKMIQHIQHIEFYEQATQYEQEFCTVGFMCLIRII